MKTIFPFLLTAVIVIAACSTKKTTTTTPASLPTVNVKPATGIYPPGTEELAAIQKQYSAATQEQLMEGYSIYTEGACIQCHRPKNIYVYSEPEWKNILIDMSKQARLSEAQTMAVYNFVFSIKATQPTGSLPQH